MTNFSFEPKIPEKPFEVNDVNPATSSDPVTTFDPVLPTPHFEILNSPTNPLKGEHGYVRTRNGEPWYHYGLDLKEAAGTPVVAAETGTVAYSGWAKGYGYVVYVDHPGGFQTRYAHLKEASPLKNGDIVVKGEFLGQVGNTGNAKNEEPHLHFEIRRLDMTIPSRNGGERTELMDVNPYLFFGTGEKPLLSLDVSLDLIKNLRI